MGVAVLASIFEGYRSSLTEIVALSGSSKPRSGTGAGFTLKRRSRS
jgi:hypothetical protein